MECLSEPTVSRKRKADKKAESGLPKLEVWPCLKELAMQLRSERAFHFDSHGELIFKVGNPKEEEVLDFLVCSRTVARSSAVFRAMLYGGFAESKPQSTDNSWVVELPEDQAFPLLIVLAIIHGHFHNIPRILEQEEMYQVLTVTEKYDMTHILYPWVKVWFQPFENIHSAAEKEMLLWISWEIGHENMVLKLSRSLLLGSQVDKNGQLLASSGVALKKYACLEPPGMLDNMTQVRKYLIKSIVDLVQATIEKSLVKRGCRCRGSQTISEDTCSNTMFGALVRLLADAGLRDMALLRTTTTYNKSVNELLRVIEGLHFKHYGCDPSCNPLPNLQKQVRKIVESVPSLVTDKHLIYLRGQAKKTGI